MSNNNLPIYAFPGGIKVDPPEGDVTYRWIQSFGGGSLPGPIQHGTINPIGDNASAGILTTNPDGTFTVEYHFCK